MLELEKAKIRQKLNSGDTDTIADTATSAAPAAPELPRPLSLLASFGNIFNPSITKRRKQKSAAFEAYNALVEDETTPTDYGVGGERLGGRGTREYIPLASDAAEGITTTETGSSRVLTQLLTAIRTTAVTSRKLNSHLSGVLNTVILDEVNNFLSQKEKIAQLEIAIRDETELPGTTDDGADNALSTQSKNELIGKLRVNSRSSGEIINRINEILRAEDRKPKGFFGGFLRFIRLGRFTRNEKLYTALTLLRTQLRTIQADLPTGASPEDIRDRIRLLLDISEQTRVVQTFSFSDPRSDGKTRNKMEQLGDKFLDKIEKIPSTYELKEQITELQAIYDKQQEIIGLKQTIAGQKREVAAAERFIAIGETSDAVISSEMGELKAQKEKVTAELAEQVRGLITADKPEATVKRDIVNRAEASSSGASSTSSASSISSASASSSLRSSASSTASADTAELLGSDLPQLSAEASRLQAETQDLASKRLGMYGQNEYRAGQAREAKYIPLETLRAEIKALESEVQAAREFVYQTAPSPERGDTPPMTAADAIAARDAAEAALREQKAAAASGPEKAAAKVADAAAEGKAKVKQAGKAFRGLFGGGKGKGADAKAEKPANKKTPTKGGDRR